MHCLTTSDFLRESKVSPLSLSLQKKKNSNINKNPRSNHKQSAPEESLGDGKIYSALCVESSAVQHLNVCSNSFPYPPPCTTRVQSKGWPGRESPTLWNATTTNHSPAESSRVGSRVNPNTTPLRRSLSRGPTWLGHFGAHVPTTNRSRPALAASTPPATSNN